MGMSIAQSGLSVARQQVAVSANDVANVNTKNYEEGQLTQASLDGGGVQATGVQREPDNSPSPPDPKPSNVDLGEEMVSQISAGHSFSMNVKSIKVQDEMMGSLLDMMG